MEISHEPTENDVKSKKLLEEFCILNDLKGLIIVGLSNDEMTMDATGMGLDYAESVDCVGFLADHVEEMADIIGNDDFVSVTMNEDSEKKN